ncbi:MAG: DNA translocase FtsK [Candidatus Omnitrophica bacterium]|nr:DNA translocase FtsK [Candidatus Omnitrophota bacterium]
MINRDRLNEIKALLLLSASLLIFISLVSFTPEDLAFYTSTPNVPAHNLARIFGARIAGTLMFFSGWGSYLFVLFFLLWAKELFQKKSASALRFINILSFFVFLFSVSSFLCIFGPELASSRFLRGGLIGLVFSDFLLRYFGRSGATIILLTLISISFIVAEEMVILPFLLKLGQRLKTFFSNFDLRLFIRRLINALKVSPSKRIVSVAKLRKTTLSPDEVLTSQKISKLEKIQTKINIKQKPRPTVVASLRSKVSKDEINKVFAPAEVEGFAAGEYKLPTLDLLDDPPALSERTLKDDLAANARILEDTLSDFGISARVTDIERGPVITRYELEPAPGIKLQKIVNLNDDIALTMKAQSVRIVAPIPGKARVGIEVPNSSTNLVYFKDVVSDKDFHTADKRLTMAIGKDIAGSPVIADLGEMPHLLIAGTTGSGKTVCVNSLIMSFLYRLSPDEVKFILVDPKMVELAHFNNIPHLLCPVVTAANKVSGALNWLVGEMERRYKLLAEVGVRNIEYFNKREDSEKLPFIIVIIDELADLMSVAANHIENAITRLAQLSRAVGIHLILATQRPSVDVVTGVIKANFPARISFKVASKVDSRTVLDRNGADKLLGRGDLLFLQPGDSKLIRAQGCLIKDSEIERVTEFIRRQGEPRYDSEVLKGTDKSRARFAQKDELFDEAVRMVIESNQASVSILQRRMRLGYTRAARLIDSMEEEGIIGSFQGSKPREILVDRESWLEKSDTKEEKYD